MLVLIQSTELDLAWRFRVGDLDEKKNRCNCWVIAPALPIPVGVAKRLATLSHPHPRPHIPSLTGAVAQGHLVHARTGKHYVAFAE